jgi:hypothetical protein
MKFRNALILVATLVLVSAGQVRTQVSPEEGERLANLNAQLMEIESREAELKIRLEQLGVDLRPENIERYFNGFGSTRPEELREARRRQLQIEKDNVLVQLEHFTSERARLVSAISDAQARAYQQSAQGASALQLDPTRRAKLLTATLTLLGLGLLAMMLLGTLGLSVAMHRRRRHI